MHYKEYQDFMRQTFNEWKEINSCREAVKLNEKLTPKYFDESNPHFFAGDFDAELVLVHLNPKRNKDQWGKECSFKNYESYEHFYMKFGNVHYGCEVPIHKSPFDHKQIRFLKPLGVLPFTGDKYKDLEIVIDNKLQLELIPYGSPDFNFNKFSNEDLQPFIERLLTVIAAKQRKHIIFCGRVFDKILAPYIIEPSKEYEFKLAKKDGQETINSYSVINIKLKIGTTEFIAAIAPQFALQGCPSTEYGKKICELYGKF